MILVQYAVVAVRFLLELAALGALGYWGFRSGTGLPMKLALGIGAPLAAAVVWGAFVAPKASFPVAVPVRVLLELCVFGSATAALYASGRSTLAAVFLTIALIDTALIYLLKL
ncbi:DUF2568 domain-containing protein [Paenibacillus mesophilus]|uniref:YrdB family protein n=1 Tax=Paenibacillus mesophilus TaxID=2582849 RepID=UPI00110E380C|nr:YrdB family protein [Paenibacillus mesophilus]TMV46851.1 DUF2568 domain-containing protein [Paenibacillus mesophilus]